MGDFEDVQKIDEIIRKHKIEAQDPDELEYSEFIDYTENNVVDDLIEIEDEYEIPDFPKSDITKFHTYSPSQFLTEEEKRIIESCPDPELKQLLLLNRNKNIQLMQVYKKIKDMLAECQQNISMKEELVQAERNAKRVCNRIWRLGIPYFKTKDHFPCPRNEDIIRKHNNGELLFYDMAPSNKWLEKDMNRLLRGVGFHYKIFKEKELEKNIKALEKELLEQPDSEKIELIRELKCDLEDVKNSDTDIYPSLGCDSHLDWNRISDNFLKERYSAQDCQIFWNTYLHPEINKGPWTSEEDERLKNLASTYSFQNWDLIAAVLGNNRTGFIACVHYFCKTDPARHGKFSEAEDKLLCDLVDKYKQGEYIPWTKITYHFKGRTRGQLFYRYKYFLSCRSNIIRGKFSEAEDILILVLVDRFGKKFTTCGQYFTNRSVIQIKARYSSNLRGALKKGSFTVEEDRDILRHVEKLGTSSWEPLVQRLNRCGGQIRQRLKTLTAFAKVHPGTDIAKAPRRRYCGVSFNAEYEFLRLMADKFKRCEKVPTLQDIEKLLIKHPKPKAGPLEPLPKEKAPHREDRVQKDKETKEQTFADKEKLTESLKKPVQYKKKQKGQRVKARLSDDDSDVDETNCDTNLAVDNLLVDFFSNSLQLNFHQSVSRQNIQRAADAVTSALSTLQAELNIPNNFEEDEHLDRIDLEILRIVTKHKPVNADNEYVITQRSFEVKKLIPPTLNTVVGMRDLLIKNQIYKTKKAKRAYIFENFRTECKEKQVQWCINNHLIHQPEDTQHLLVSERSMFFRRFVSLFKFPAIMTLQKPSEMLESSSKTWKNECTMGVKTYTMKKSRPIPAQDERHFASVFIKQQPQEEYGHNPSAAQDMHSSSMGNKGKISVTKSYQSQNHEPTKKGVNCRTDLGPKMSIVEQLKRRINNTIDELSISPPPKRFYKDTLPPIPATVSCDSKQNCLPDKPVRNVADSERIKTYTPRTKVQVKVESSITLNKGRDRKKNKSVNVQKENENIINDLKGVNQESQQACSSFNVGKGELVLETNSPRSSVSGSNAINQDLIDLTALDAVLKREKSVIEESFDF